MGTFSPTHWFIVFVMITPLMALLVVPTWRILQRAGFNGAWALLMLVPLANFMLLWFVAFLKWPNDREQRTRTSKGWLVVGVVLLPLAMGVLALMASVATGPESLATGWGNGQLSSPSVGTSTKDQFGGELVSPAK